MTRGSLLVEAVDFGDEGVGAEPAMGGELALLRAGVSERCPGLSRCMWQVWQLETVSLV